MSSWQHPTYCGSYCIAPNYHGKIFLWFSWLTQYSQIFFTKIGMSTAHSRVPSATAFHENEYFSSLEHFTKFLCHESLELYSNWFIKQCAIWGACFVAKMIFCTKWSNPHSKINWPQLDRVIQPWTCNLKTKRGIRSLLNNLHNYDKCIIVQIWKTLQR